MDLTIDLLENIGINKYAIELIKGKQAPYRLIYLLNPVELETLKAYIETHHKTGFKKLFKSLASRPILFNKKPNNSLHPYDDYQDFNKLIIKNLFLIRLISKTLDRLD